MRVLTLNWGHGPYSISKIIRDIEAELNYEDVSFFHLQESGEELGENYKSLSGWLEYRIYYVLAHITGRRYGTGYIPYLRVKKYIKSYTPDIVHIHCPNGFSINLYKVFNYLKKEHIPTVITNHAEFFYTGNCAHSDECMQFVSGCHGCVEYKERIQSWFFNRTEWAWRKMKMAFENFDTLYMIAVSNWMQGRMKLSPISNKLTTAVIMNGIDTNIFKWVPCGESNDKIRRVVHVTSHFSDDISDMKGGYYVIELAKRCLMLPIEFIVIGDNYVKEENVPKNMKIVGIVKEQNELASYYRNADLTLLTSKRETFGMTCAESLACGTKVIGFYNGGTESIAIKQYTHLVEFGDIEKLKRVMLETLDEKIYEKSLISKEAEEKYSKKTMARNYLKIYQQAVKKGR